MSRTTGCSLTVLCESARWKRTVVPSPPRKCSPRATRNTGQPGSGVRIRPTTVSTWISTIQPNIGPSPGARATTAPPGAHRRELGGVEVRPWASRRLCPSKESGAIESTATAACSPASRSSARSASTSGLPVVSSFSP